MKISVRFGLSTCIVALCVALCGCASGATSGATSGASGVSAPSASAEAAQASASEQAAAESPLADGTYEVAVETDSNMFHLNEAVEGKGELTVANGVMTVHIILPSKNIINLYPGLADQAKSDEAGWLQPTEDEVTYSDGYTKEVYGFDVPVSALDEPFDVAILGTKGKWYDHKVTVAKPEAE